MEDDGDCGDNTKYNLAQAELYLAVLHVTAFPMLTCLMKHISKLG
jgi:hypothetical protein